MFESQFSHLPPDTQPNWPQDFPQELVSPVKEVRMQALLKLKQVLSSDAIPVLIEMLKYECDPEIHSQAKALLLHCSDPAQSPSRRDPLGIFRI